MKILSSIVFAVLLFIPYGCQNPGAGELQKEDIVKDAAGERYQGERSGQRQPVDWMNFNKPGDEVLKKQLTPLQYEVTQREGTEPAFRNEYNANKAEGIYVDIVSGEPLFSALDKYDSGTGWPSFTKPLDPDNIVTREDRGILGTRTEVRSKHGDSHLGTCSRMGRRQRASGTA
jgi:methionine-R-sulfoxide reductase